MNPIQLTTPTQKAYAMSNPTQAQPVSTQQVKIAANPIHTIGTQQKTPLAVSYNANMCAYVDNAHTIYILDISVPEPKIQYVLPGIEHDVRSLSFSPNDQLLAAASGQTITIFELSSESILFQFDRTTYPTCHEGPVSIVKFFNNELLLSGGYDSDLKCYQITQGEVKAEVKLVQDQQKDRLLIKNNKYTLVYIDGYNAHKTQVNGIVTTFADSNIIASFSRDGIVKIFDISNWIKNIQGPKQLFQLEAHKSEILCGCFSANMKKFIAGSKDNYISVWDLENGKLLKFFQAHNCDVTFVQFLNADQYLFTASQEGDFKLWQAENGQIAAVQDNMVNEVYQTDEDQSIAVLQQPDLAQLLKSQSRNTAVEVPVMTYQLHERDMHAVILGLRKPIMITAQHTQYLRIWNVQSVTKPTLIKEIFSHTEAISSISNIDENAQVCLVTSKDGYFSILNVEKANKLINVDVGCSILNGIYYKVKDQVFISTSLYEVVGYQIVKDQLPKKFCVFRGHTASISKITIVQNVLISGSMDGYIMTWDIPAFSEQVQTIKPSQKLQDHDGFITCLVSNQSTVASAAADHNVIIYTLSGNKLKQQLIIKCAHSAYISGLLLTPSSIFTCSHDSTIKQFKTVKNSNSKYDSSKAVFTGNVDRLQEYVAKMQSISSEKCTKICGVPFSYGLPNCICSLQEKIAIGTTNGQIMIFSDTLEIIQINDLHEDGMGEVQTSICGMRDQIVCGQANGTVHVWGSNSEKTVNMPEPVAVLAELLK
ncbi:G-beta repeat-containing protein [Hexamita inflata]|uniref:G-beta repeat-containing protein n=1 Tax=Hexamita inflata TaxID=28002 RepID=A0AA86PJ99_9EUKA|nr:G-beta repeat-containing protein [Hexamita inflata]